jgi:glycosyltransferase involved in cell wall biosynthesis
MKFALISKVLPPSETAHAAIIQRLLRDIDPANYCLLSSTDYGSEYSGPDYTDRLDGKFYHLPEPYQLIHGYRFGLNRIRERLNLLLAIADRARIIRRIIKQEQCDAVVVCTGGREVFDFPAGYLAAKLSGARFYAYLLDQYSHMVRFVMGNSFLRRFEPWVMKDATAVIVPNEFMRDEVKGLYGVDSVIIRNTCDVTAYEPSMELRPPDTAEVRIVYTGSVGPAHFDAFRNLVTAINLLQRTDVRLHLYTANTRLEEANVLDVPAVVVHEHEPVGAMPDIHKQADVLFLPLAFDSNYRDIVRTAAPGKICEYLSARRPVLVHAPADSFIAWYFREHDCGVVADIDDPIELAHALERIITDPELRKRISERAWYRAQSDFDLPRAQARFASVLGLTTAPPKPAKQA